MNAHEEVSSLLRTLGAPKYQASADYTLHIIAMLLHARLHVSNVNCVTPLYLVLQLRGDRRSTDPHKPYR